MASLLRRALGVMLVMLLAAPAAAKPFTLQGLTFSDELGGFTILDAKGSGSVDDPFVVVEDVTAPDGVTLVIRGLSPDFGNRVGSQHLTGFALTKVVINHTGNVWNMFSMELREVPQNQSPYGDGLSFGQAAAVGRPFLSNRFKRSSEVDEPYDSVSFSDGVVEAGESVTFKVIITDMSPVPRFLLLQQPEKAVAATTAHPLAATMNVVRPF